MSNVNRQAGAYWVKLPYPSGYGWCAGPWIVLEYEPGEGWSLDDRMVQDGDLEVINERRIVEPVDAEGYSPDGREKTWVDGYSDMVIIQAIENNGKNCMYLEVEGHEVILTVEQAHEISDWIKGNIPNE